MEAEPAPASFENAALLNPSIKTPKAPPKPASGENAVLNIKPKASSIYEKLDSII